MSWKKCDVDTERNVTRVLKLFLLISLTSDSQAALRREEAFLLNLLPSEHFSHVSDKLVKLWIIAETISTVNYSYHGLYCLSRPLPAVFLHRPPPGCSRPRTLLRRDLCSPQLLGFLRLLRTPHYLLQPGVLDLLVPGKPGGVNGGVTPQMRSMASSFAAQSGFLAAGAGKWNQSYIYRCRYSHVKPYTIKTCCEGFSFNKALFLSLQGENTQLLLDLTGGCLYICFTTEGKVGL